MATKKVLYISGSLGLGHIIRDLAIADELRRQKPEVEISWLAAHPASKVLVDAGENLLPEADQYADDNIPAEEAATEGFHLNLLQYLTKAVGTWKRNVAVFARVIDRERFDLIGGDETYELAVAMTGGDVQVDVPFVMIFDFIGNDSMSWNPVERLGTYMWNREWAKSDGFYDGERRTALFVGQPEDIPDTGLGPFLPNRRAMARRICHFVGYVLQFDPGECADRRAIRAKLDYGEEPLIVCSVGGTSVGKELLTLCVEAYPAIREEVPDAQMVLVCGPRLAPESLAVPEGVDVRGYVPALYEHLATSDLAIVHGGGTTTLELTALRRPFLYFPLEGHFEQQVHVANRLARHQAGIKMAYSKTTPKSLGEQVIANLGKEVTYPPIPTDGARKAAEVMGRFL